MRVAKDQVDIRMQIPGAVIRQRKDFGEITATARSAANISRWRRASIRRPVPGLEGNCASARIGASCCKGELTTTDAAGKQETVGANDLFYWPPGHNVRVDADAEIIMFSPQHEHTHVIDHMLNRVNGYA